MLKVQFVQPSKFFATARIFINGVDISKIVHSYDFSVTDKGIPIIKLELADPNLEIETIKPEVIQTISENETNPY